MITVQSLSSVQEFRKLFESVQTVTLTFDIIKWTINII